MSQSNDAVRRFVPGKLTSARLNEVVDNGNETVRRVNKLEAPPDVPRASTPLPCKITDVVSVGKYYADAYLPPYRASEPDPDAIADLAEADLGTRTAQVILWNLSELSGGSALAVDDWVDASVAGLDASGYPLMKTAVASGSGSFATRMKVKTASGSDLVAIANTWDGSTAGADDIPVRMAVPAKVGMNFIAIEADPNTGSTYSGDPVTWMELVGGTHEGTATATVIGDSIEGSETADTVFASSGVDDVPVNIWMESRVVYNDAGDEILYRYARKLKVNSRGLLYAEGAETRITVDAPDDCGTQTVNM